MTGEPLGAKLNLGAGGRCMEGWINLDRVWLPGIDVVHDLDRKPWPLADESVAEIEAKDVFEHLDDAVLFVTECWRILRVGGLLTVTTTHWSNVNAFTDPTHRRFPTKHTFDFWIPGTIFYREHNAAYGGVAFQPVEYHQAPADNGSVAAQRFKMRKMDLEAAKDAALRQAV